ncbi:MAG: ABC transporter permease [Thiolinea sp.]
MTRFNQPTSRGDSMDFLYFFFKRIAVAIPLLLGISLVSFAIIQAVPGDYVDTWVANTSAQTGKSYDELLPQAQAMRERLGLDQPVVVQYVKWLKNIVFHGDFGMSFKQKPPGHRSDRHPLAAHPVTGHHHPGRQPADRRVAGHLCRHQPV